MDYAELYVEFNSSGKLFQDFIKEKNLQESYPYIYARFKSINPKFRLTKQKQTFYFTDELEVNQERILKEKTKEQLKQKIHRLEKKIKEIKTINNSFV